MGILSKALNGNINEIGDLTLGYSDKRMYNPGYIGWECSEVDYYNNNYENAFASIRVIVSRFADIEPFVIDKTGNSVESNLLDRIYTPNKGMSAYDFREALAVMSLVHNKVYIRPHFKGSRKTVDTLKGFTILQGIVERVVDGKVIYTTPNGDTFSSDELIILKSANPYNLNEGFSHAYASRRWTTLDDYITDYQAGFFRNGAVPSGVFLIRAKTYQDFIDIKRNMQNMHRGANKNGNVAYDWLQTDATGNTSSTIDWKPFNVENRNLALKDLFDEANKKIDSVYGVPASLRGVNDRNTYASVRVDEQIFFKNTLKPFATKIWSKFNHELNRITGGLGVAIDFYEEEPIVIAEKKEEAETKQIQANTVIALSQYFEIDSIAQYIETGDIRTLIEKQAVIEKPQIASSDELKDTPEQPVDINHQKSVKGVKDVKKNITPRDRAKYESEFFKVVKDHMTKQIEDADSIYDLNKSISFDEPISEEETEKMADDMMAVIMSLLLAYGSIEAINNARTLQNQGVVVGNIENIPTINETQIKSYQEYIHKVATSYNEITAEKIREVITLAHENNYTRNDYKKALRGVIEDWRIERISRTEIEIANNECGLFSMQNIAKELDINVYKVWRTNSANACSFCSSNNGKKVPVDNSFYKIGQEIHDHEGGVMRVDFRNLETPNPHPDCHCSLYYEVEA